MSDGSQRNPVNSKSDKAEQAAFFKKSREAMRPPRKPVRDEQTREEMRKRPPDEIELRNCEPVENCPYVAERFSFILDCLLQGKDDAFDPRQLRGLGPEEQAVIEKLKPLSVEARKVCFDDLVTKEVIDKKLADDLDEFESVNPDAVIDMAEMRKIVGNVQWLWHGWIPCGMMSMLFGPPGGGKSMFAVGAIIRSVTTGVPWPDGQPGPQEVRPVIYCNSEGAQSVHCERVANFGLPEEMILNPGGSAFDSFRITKESITQLEQLVMIYRPGLIVIDSFKHAHEEEENSSKVSGVAQPLYVLAQKYNVAVLIVHHSRKNQGGLVQGLEDSRGSSSLTAISRTVIALDTPDDSQEQIKRVRMLKTFHKIPPALSMTIGQIDKGEGLKFSGIVPAENREKQQSGRPAKSRSKVEDWIREQFSDGEPIPSKELESNALDAGFSKSTFERALKRLGITAERVGTKGPWLKFAPEEWDEQQSEDDS